MTIKMIGVFVAAVILFWIDMPILRKQKSIRDIVMFLLLLTAAIVLGLAKVLKLYSSTPLYMISWLFKPLSDLIQMLQ